MKILLIHADFIEFKIKEKAIQAAEEFDEKEGRAEDCLVVFTAVEKADEKDPNKAADMLVSEIEDVARQLKAESVVLYPYAHLSSNLAIPSVAKDVLKLARKKLQDKFKLSYAPFGWYKEFNIKTKGHPLSELSRELNIDTVVDRSMDAKGGQKKESDVSEAVKKEEQLKSEWFIIEPDGKIHKVQKANNKVEGFDFKKHEKLLKLCQYEIAKNRLLDKEPPHIKLMKKLELANYEEGSDPGNFRFMPKGRLMKSLLEQFVTEKVIDYGGMEVETPIMYDYEHPSLKSYLNRFPARQYTIYTPNKKVFLRFAACFGQFLMAKDAIISYRNLPFRIYELTRYSFRVEQRGELAGLRRLRAFTMPDCHCLVKDYEQAKEEMGRRWNLAKSVIEGSGLSLQNDLELAIRVTKEFFEEHKDFVFDLIKKNGKPALVEIWDKRFFYFVLKYEWNFIDALDKAATLTTDQIDVENAERYGIQYTDIDNKKKYPLILHLSPSGALERVMYALLEKAHMKAEGRTDAKGVKHSENPVFPLWLSPTQVRICPVNDNFVKDAEEIAQELISNKIRADIDDTNEGIGKKIFNAESEWTPFIIVIGEKEKESGKLAVRIRENRKVEQMTTPELMIKIKEQTEGFPFKKLSLPLKLSERAKFV